MWNAEWLIAQRTIWQFYGFIYCVATSSIYNTLNKRKEPKAKQKQTNKAKQNKNNKQWSAKYYTEKKSGTRIPLKTQWIRLIRRVSNSCSTSGISRLILLKNLMISHKWGQEETVITKKEHIRGHAIVNAASNISYRPLLDAADTGRGYRSMFLQFFWWTSLRIWPML